MYYCNIAGSRSIDELKKNRIKITTIKYDRDRKSALKLYKIIKVIEIEKEINVFV